MNWVILKSCKTGAQNRHSYFLLKFIRKPPRQASNSIVVNESWLEFCLFVAQYLAQLRNWIFGFNVSSRTTGRNDWSKLSPQIWNQMRISLFFFASLHFSKKMVWSFCGVFCAHIFHYFFFFTRLPYEWVMREKNAFVNYHLTFVK